MQTKGKYYKSLKEYMNAGGSRQVLNNPCIHVSGSIRGMRRDFWGYKCDVVRVGLWIYKA